MIATFLFYLEEMIAALIFFTAFFLVAGGAILFLFVLNRAYKRAFELAEMQYRQYVRGWVVSGIWAAWFLLITIGIGSRDVRKYLRDSLEVLSTSLKLTFSPKKHSDDPAYQIYESANGG